MGRQLLDSRVVKLTGLASQVSILDFGFWINFSLSPPLLVPLSMSPHPFCYSRLDYLRFYCPGAIASRIASAVAGASKIPLR